MKKVWILEKFESVEDMNKVYTDMKSVVEYAKNNDGWTNEQIDDFENAVIAYESKIKENPNGYWYGFEGKEIYRQFCDVAKAAIRRNPEAKFRVVEAEIPDDAKYWLGYKFVKENEGVYRYLMATK